MPHSSDGATEVLVALTREVGHNDVLRELVGDRAETVEIPLTSTHYRDPADVASEVEARTAGVEVAVVVVSSGRLRPYLGSVRPVVTERTRVLSVGEATSAMLREEGWRVDGESSHGIGALAANVAGGPVLVLSALGGRTELAEELRERRVEVTTIGCYETRSLSLSLAEGRHLGRCDVVFIGAPSAWRTARTWVSDESWVLVPGATTLEVVRRDHHRAIEGWGQSFANAWETIERARP